MSAFIGGSAFAMVRDITEGYIIISESTFKKFQSGDYASFLFELDKATRELRGTVVPINEVEATQKKNRKLQRLVQTMAIANGAKTKWKK
jgi:hypothetical protein